MTGLSGGSSAICVSDRIQAAKAERKDRSRMGFLKAVSGFI